MIDPTVPLDMLGREIELNDMVAYATGYRTGSLKLARVTQIDKNPKMDGGYVRVGVVAFAEGLVGMRWTEDSHPGLFSGRRVYPSVSKMVIVTKYAGSIGEAVARDEEGRG